MTADDHDIAMMFRLLNEIGIIAQLSGNAFEKVMSGGMTLPQFIVLNHLIRLGGNRTPLQIARALQVSKGAMTNTLGHLERHRHIHVTPDAEDKRSKRIDVSEAGRAAHRAALEAMQPELAFLAERVRGAQVAEVLPLLVELRQTLDERR